MIVLSDRLAGPWGETLGYVLYDVIALAKYSFSLVMMSLSFLAALPPSEATLRKVFENTSDLCGLCVRLSIPRDKRDVDSAVEYYVQSTDPMKIRKMIYWLDRIGDTSLADSVMEYAELPAGMATIETPSQLYMYKLYDGGDWFIGYTRVCNLQTTSKAIITCLYDDKALTNEIAQKLSKRPLFNAHPRES